MIYFQFFIFFQRKTFKILVTIGTADIDGTFKIYLVSKVTKPPATEYVDLSAYIWLYSSTKPDIDFIP